MELCHFDWHVQIVLCLCSPQLFQRSFPFPPHFNYTLRPSCHLSPCQASPPNGPQLWSFPLYQSLSSPWPGTMRTTDKSFHYLAPLLGLSPLYLSLSFSLYQTRRAFLNRETVQLMAVASFCLLFWFPTPFISFFPKQSQREGMGGLNSLLVILPRSLSNFHPAFPFHFQQSGEVRGR